MSRTPDCLYFGSNVTQRVKPVAFLLDEERLLTVDLSAYCGTEGTELGAASWNVLGSADQVSLGDPDTGAQTTACMVSAADTGQADIQVTVSLDNTEILVFVFRCVVTDPQYAACPVDNYGD